MDKNKKKTRQRCRPRNKANRINFSTAEVQSELKKDNPETAKENFNDVDINKVQKEEFRYNTVSAIEESTKKAKNVKDLENIGNEGKQSKQDAQPTAAVQSSQTLQPTAALQPTVTAGPSTENNDVIRLIQQILRTKLIKSKANNDAVGSQPNEAPSLKEHMSNGYEDSAEIKNAAGYSQPNEDNKMQVLPKPIKTKGKVKEKSMENQILLQCLQKKMENVMTNGTPADLSTSLLGNLQKLISQEPVNDVETSDEEEEYIEYIYKPRQYFLVCLCNFCKADLCNKQRIQCTRCMLTYYCSNEHMKSDQQHKQLCYGLRQVAESCDGGHIFHKTGVFSSEQFRSYRIVTIRKVESVINRSLTAMEQEVVLFPRICNEVKCREYKFGKLNDCNKCGQVSFCKANPDHLNASHKNWCKAFQLFKEMVIFQEKFGRLDPSLPTKILKDLPAACSNTKQIFSKLGLDIVDPCEYAALTQISTAPLTAWYSLKVCDQLRNAEVMTIHLIGAEIEFEVDVLQKWELFFLHITPSVKELNIVFVGPELNPRNISFEQLRKTRSCLQCRKNERTVKYHFECKLYHEYCGTEAFINPNLICFFNAGIYRCTGFHMEDTWPETILAASRLKCPVVVTSYTAYEAPLDMTRFVQECNRRLNVVLPPIINPFASDKPERNFISDEEAPLMFKNYYCFVIE